MLFPDRRRRRARSKDPDPDSVVGSGEEAGVTSLDALLADPTPDPHSPGSSSNVDPGHELNRTHVLQSVGVGEVPGHVRSDGAGPTSAPVEARPVSFTGSSAGLLMQIPVDAIQPNEFQPRRRFDETALAALTESVRELGVLQPILVRRAAVPPTGPESTIEFELVAGERRWRAARRAGLTKVPAIVREVSDLRSLEEAIVENLHRSDLNPMEEAAAYQQLIDEFGLSQAQVAQRVGKSRSAVANTLRLVQLPVPVQRLVAARELSAGHARAVLMVPPFDQPEFAARIVSDELSVRQAEDVAQNWSESRRGGTGGRRPTGGGAIRNGGQSKGRTPRSRTTGALEVERHLGDHLDTRVRVEETAKGGRIVVDFADADDLSRIFGLLVDSPVTGD